MVTCPECNSHELVWDYSRGDVVCHSCGLVIERIYVYTQPRRSGEEEARAHHKHRANNSIAKAKKRIQAFRELQTRFKLRPYLTYSPKIVEKIANGERIKHVKTIVRKDQLTTPTDTNVQAVLAVLSKYPRIYSRTDRVRLALAHALVEVALNNRVRIRSIARRYRIDPTNLRRAYKTAMAYKNLLGEIKLVVN